MVTGTGRPFFVQVINPKKRNVKFQKKITLDHVSIFGLKSVESLPKESLKFRSKIDLFIETEDPIKKNSLRKLKNIKNSPIVVYKDSNRIEKSIYSLNIKQQNSKSFFLEILADGGLPIKKFVDSDSVFPNVSDLLGTKCKCKYFDFREVLIK